MQIKKLTNPLPNFLLRIQDDVIITIVMSRYSDNEILKYFM